jgi:NAD(P)-dependent dehydrogenase (short-subunit alcohol dehydrogenase family)
MDSVIYEILPALRMICSKKSLHSLSYFERANAYAVCMSEKDTNAELLKNAIYIKNSHQPDEIIGRVKEYAAEDSKAQCIFIEGKGVILATGNPKASGILRNALEVFLEKKMKRSNEIFQSIPEPSSHAIHLVSNKITIVTGGAMGFGEGIVRDLFLNGANVVIADVNLVAGGALADELNQSTGHPNSALFVECDVSKEASVKSLVEQTVANYGGLDILISNAGILRAGGLDEMDLETFELTTKINYSAYFLCVKYASEVMKRQFENPASLFMDIIQINSKSGLRGSNRNFAYAGGKFGGIGLTQSFALELMPFNIKVNAVCPGNFFEGPLWADPETGLFVQYLKTGKVPHAKTIDDVKKYYENLVPARRGCTLKDVMKAIYYIIDQEYETGQAVPVTGGQVMLG